MYIEKGNLLIEISKERKVFDFLIHYGTLEVLWFRVSTVINNIELNVFGRTFINWDFIRN